MKNIADFWIPFSLLLLFIALACDAIPSDADSPSSTNRNGGASFSRVSRHDRSERFSWGRIANADHRGEAIYAALYFAGPPNPKSLPLYTRHPRDPRLNGWSDGDVDFALKRMTDAGLNCIKLSYWGYQGETDRWSPAWLFSQTRWPGDEREGPYSEADQVRLARRFYESAGKRRLLIAPMLEVSPAFQLARIDSPDLIRRATWLLRNLGDEPNGLRVRDKNGESRLAIWLLDYPTGDPNVFAGDSSEFDRAAEAIEANVGRKVGFILDPISLAAYRDGSLPMPEQVVRSRSILAVNTFMPSLQGVRHYADDREIPASERLERTEAVFKIWASGGVPFLPSVTPGYDARIVFPRSGSYGFTPEWRDAQTRLALRYSTDGVSFDLWNGWTEGYSIPPTLEDGDANFRWATDLVSALKRRGKARGSAEDAP